MTVPSLRERPTLSALKTLVQAWEKPSEKESFSVSFLSQKIPRGALTEISGTPGNGKTEVILKFLAENPDLQIAWIEDRFTAYPSGFLQRGVVPEKIFFTEGGGSMLWAASQILRSQLFDVVILAAQDSGYRGIRSIFEEKNLRRLQLAAEGSNASVVLLSRYPTTQRNWPIHLQLQVGWPEMETNEESFLHQEAFPIIHKLKSSTFSCVNG